MLASSSVPTVFPPRRMGDDVYVDSGIVQGIPLTLPALELGGRGRRLIAPYPNSGCVRRRPRTTPPRTPWASCTGRVLRGLLRPAAARSPKYADGAGVPVRLTPSSTSSARSTSPPTACASTWTTAGCGPARSSATCRHQSRGRERRRRPHHGGPGAAAALRGGDGSSHPAFAESVASADDRSRRPRHLR